jgi:hypothetical protein
VKRVSKNLEFVRVIGGSVVVEAHGALGGFELEHGRAAIPHFNIHKHSALASAELPVSNQLSYTEHPLSWTARLRMLIDFRMGEAKC